MVNKAKEEKKKLKKKLKKKDKEWSIRIKKTFKNTCAFCLADKYIQAHHIIPRVIKEFRHSHLNGIALCPKHHKWGMTSAHGNPLWFFMMLEKIYPFKLKVLKLKYAPKLGR